MEEMILLIADTKALEKILHGELPLLPIKLKEDGTRVEEEEVFGMTLLKFHLEFITMKLER